LPNFSRQKQSFAKRARTAHTTAADALVGARRQTGKASHMKRFEALEGRVESAGLVAVLVTVVLALGGVALS
jgi:hypothetical protein